MNRKEAFCRHSKLEAVTGGDTPGILPLNPIDKGAGPFSHYCWFLCQHSFIESCILLKCKEITRVYRKIAKTNVNLT